MKLGQAPSSRTYHLSHPTPLAVLYYSLLPFSRQHMRSYFSNSQAILSFVNILNSAFKSTRSPYQSIGVIFPISLYFTSQNPSSKSVHTDWIEVRSFILFRGSFKTINKHYHNLCLRHYSRC